MKDSIKHHIPDELIAAYAAGNLPKAFSVVVASHVSMCDECRARLSAHEAAGGAVLEETGAQEVSDAFRASVLSMLDAPAPIEAAPQPRRGVYPGPIMEMLKGKPPRWRALGGGVKQCILDDSSSGSARLLYIPAGQAVPDHGHNGMELTMVLQGAFSDETGRFDVGDVEVADADLDHVPTADEGLPCICLAATDAPLKFNSFIPRLLQPIFNI